MKTRKVVANQVWLNDKVVEYEETLWGWRDTVETVTNVFCIVQDHMVEVELRVGQVLKHIRRYSLDANVTEV
jgi:hypothetical protein